MCVCACVGVCGCVCVGACVWVRERVHVNGRDSPDTVRMTQQPSLHTGLKPQPNTYFQNGVAASGPHCEDRTVASSPYCDDGTTVSGRHCKDGTAVSD